MWRSRFMNHELQEDMKVEMLAMKAIIHFWIIEQFLRENSYFLLHVAEWKPDV